MPPDPRPVSRARLAGAAATAAMLAALLVPASARARAADHVVVVIMENHAYDQVRGAPYTASLIAQSASFSQAHALTHPSQPNYLMLWAASNLGVTNNDCPAPGSPFGAENLGHACEAAGLTWKAYSENLPAPGSPVCDADGGLYARRHEPWTQFGNLTHANEVPFSQLGPDIGAGSLPDLAFVVPNNCDNTHDCSIATGDAWLGAHLPAMVTAAGPRGLVILTWDEDDGSAGNHILTVFAGPLVQSNLVSSQPITHYSVVRAICDVLGLLPFANALDAAPITGVWAPGVQVHVTPATPRVKLGPVRPNPSRGPVSARLELPAEHAVEAAIFDPAGRRVRRLFAGPRRGVVEVAWDGRRGDGRRVRAGLYFLRVTVDGVSLHSRLVRIE